jgi:hypothetical protein
MRTCIATVSYGHAAAAETGHKEITTLLKSLEIGGKMSEPFDAIEAYAKKKTGTGVRSYRVYSGHAVEGKVTVKVSPERKQ